MRWLLAKEKVAIEIDGYEYHKGERIQRFELDALPVVVLVTIYLDCDLLLGQHDIPGIRPDALVVGHWGGNLCDEVSLPAALRNGV